MSDDSLARTLRTAFNLRFSQLLSRLKYRWERRTAPDPNRYRFSGPGTPALRSELPRIRDSLATTANNVEQLSRGIVKQLNMQRVIGYKKVDWSLGPCTQDRLWTVTLHYHRWLADLARSSDGANAEVTAALCRHYLTDWISRCALDASGARDLAWNSYAISTRIAEWISIYTSIGRELFSAPEFESVFLGSLYQQASYLHSHVEYDLRANHLMRDALGLAWAGRFFDGAQPKRWLETATQLAMEQSREQVHSDGGHFERSPMYHLEVMHDIYSLAHLLEDAEAKRQLAATWTRMAEFAAWVRHPDGQIPLLNDAALNGTRTPAQMLALANELNASCDPSLRSGGKYFPDTGLVVWHGEPWSIFFDVGAIGPNYQPGHGHADTLSLECSYKGVRLFVDAGTHSYDLDDRRRYDRSTAAHNTVGIDAEDSSEVWQIFRVGRRAHPLDAYADFVGGGFNACAGHDGFTHLRGRPRHFRRIEFGKQQALSVEDRIEGSGKHRLAGGWLLHPDCSARPVAGGWEIQTPAGSLKWIVDGPVGMKRFEKQCAYHPEFGLERMTTRLCWKIEGADLPVIVKARAE